MKSQPIDEFNSKSHVKRVLPRGCTNGMDRNELFVGWHLKIPQKNKTWNPKKILGHTTQNSNFPWFPGKPSRFSKENTQNPPKKSGSYHSKFQFPTKSPKKIWEKKRHQRATILAQRPPPVRRIIPSVLVTYTLSKMAKNYSQGNDSGQLFLDPTSTQE